MGSRRSRDVAGGAGRPRVLVLASDELFPMFFPQATIVRLESIADWERCADREVSAPAGAAVARADALVTTWHSPFLHADLLEATDVRLIVHCGGELSARMEPAVLERVTVVNTPEPMAGAVAEMALAMMLCLVRRLREHERAVREGAGPDNAVAAEGETLAGRRVGIVGFGRIGRRLASLLVPFGVELAIADPWGSEAEASRFGARLLGLDRLLESSSVVVLAAALTEETRGLLDRRRLALLRDGSYLVNVARGGLVDLEALSDELASGRIAAALDVTDPLEPLPLDHPLRRLPNVLLTPHVAAGGIEVRRAIGVAAVEAIERFFRGERLDNVVTRELLLRMT